MRECAPLTMCHMSHVRCHTSGGRCQVSGVRFFFGQSGGDSWWSVSFYQRGLPHQVFNGFDHIIIDWISRSSLLMLDFVGQSVEYTLHTLYKTHCTPCTIRTTHFVKYTLNTLYNTHCMPCAIHTAHLVNYTLNMLYNTHCTPRCLYQ